MAQQRPRPISAGVPAQFASTPKESSMLMNMIPSMVQNRIPQLPSLRRSVSMVGLKARRGIKSRPSTPVDDSKALVLSSNRAEELTTDIVEDVSSGEEYEGGSLHREQWRTSDITENKSGIGWKYAGQGLSLLSLSINESSLLTNNSRSATASPSFARQLYIHALTYLLRGLPSNLTAEETIAVRSALSPELVVPMRVEVAAGSGNLFLDANTRMHDKMKENQPSVLHRTLATTIINFFLFIQLVLPYVKVLLQAAYQFERSHNISEKLLASGIDTVDGIGKIGMKGGNVLWGSGIALGFGEVVAWIAEGVSGGIQEGLGEGMARVGVRKNMEVRTKDQL